MNVDSILNELRRAADPKTKATFLRHGAQEPIFGVKVENLKKIQKRIKKDHALALELYATGNGDAMYLAGLICDPVEMKKSDLKRWAQKATWSMISEYIVPWTAAESRHGRELALEWVDAKKEHLAAAGWSTYISLMGITPDEELDLVEIRKLLARIEKEIHRAPNRVRGVMNMFVISVGTYVRPLLAEALTSARRIGAVTVVKEGTSCKAPDAIAYIDKVVRMGRVGKKRKTAFC